MIHHGDCLEVMAAMEPESVDSIVCDPPYDLVDIGRRFQGSGGSVDPRTGRERSNQRTGGFMGKTWDGTGIAFRRETWEAAYRVAKPSSYLLAFGGTRTVHRMTVALEDAGWIIRDMLVWAYASGFPKSKASLKPAWEPIVMARKPGPLRMLAIDECRIGTEKDIPASPSRMEDVRTHGKFGPTPTDTEGWNPNSGRWPANVILTDPIFDGGVEGVVGGGEAGSVVKFAQAGNVGGKPRTGGTGDGVTLGISGPKEAPSSYGDSGTYSRFFLIPKADRADREPMLGALENRHSGSYAATGGRAPSARANVHPTVKPTELMRHLVRLVTPVGGTVLDPFLGSGTTGLACELEGFPWIGIEREAEYVAIAEARLNGTQRGLGLVV